jgi:hypothetical protein
LYAYAGNNDRTLYWLERGVEARDPNMLYVSVWPLFIDLLGDDPRFKDLLQRINLPEVE